MSSIGGGYGEGFFYSPEDQAAQQTLRRQQAYAQALLKGARHEGQYGGLADAGDKIAGALLANRADKREADLSTKSQAAYTKAMADLLKGTTAQSPQVSNAPGMATQLDPEGNPMAPGQGTPGYQAAPQQQTPSSFADRIAASGNPALMYQFGPKIIESQFNRENTMWERGLPMTQADKQQAELQGQISRGNAEFTNKLPMTAAQIAADRRQGATLSETRRHNMADEDAARNPFGVGVGNSETGDNFLKSLPPSVAGQVKAIASYRQPAPASRSKQSMALMAAVNQYRPDYDSTQFGAKTKARNDFATGKNGNTVRSLNVAVQHLDQLGQLSDAMQNNNVQAFNKIGNWFASQTGNPAPSNFNAARQLVGDEIVKAIVGAGGGVADREEAAHNISAASSPAQLAGVIKTYQGLLAGQLVGLRQQYQKSTGLDDFEDFLAPETRLKLEDHGAPGAAPSPAPAAAPTITPEQAAAELARRRGGNK